MLPRSVQIQCSTWCVGVASRTWRKRVKLFNVTVDDMAILEAGHRVCLRIEEELRLHYGHKAPSLGGIRRILSQFIDDVKELEDKREQAQKRPYSKKKSA